MIVSIYRRRKAMMTLGQAALEEMFGNEYGTARVGGVALSSMETASYSQPAMYDPNLG